MWLSGMRRGHCQLTPSSGGLLDLLTHRPPRPAESTQPDEKRRLMRSLCSALAILGRGCFTPGPPLHPTPDSLVLFLPRSPPRNTPQGCGGPLSPCWAAFPFPDHPGLFSLQKLLCTEPGGWSAAKSICKRGKFPLCVLLKHLTRIKVSPRGTNFTY